MRKYGAKQHGGWSWENQLRLMMMNNAYIHFQTDTEQPHLVAKQAVQLL